MLSGGSGWVLVPGSLSSGREGVTSSPCPSHGQRVVSSQHSQHLGNKRIGLVKGIWAGHQQQLLRWTGAGAQQGWGGMDGFMVT